MYASVSRLDSFALLRSTDWMDVERFVAQVKEPFRETPEMNAGKDIHKFAEHRPVTPDQIVSDYGFDWDREQVANVINMIPQDTAVEIRGGIEVPTSRWGPLWVPGRADGITGIQGRDIKTTFGNFKVESYPDAYQWRFYMPMFGLKRFVYDLIKINRDKKSDTLTIFREEPLSMWTYPEVWQDCCNLVEDFMVTMERLNLLDYLLTKTEKENVANTAKTSG